MSLYAELKRRNVLRIATAYIVGAWLVIQVVETTFPVFGISNDAIRIVIIVLIIGFVPAVVGAWIYQVTPDGIRLDKDAADSPADRRSAKLLDRAILLILVAGIAYFAFDKFVLAPERLIEAEEEAASAARAEAQSGFYGDRSVAVVPFVNLSPDIEQQYVADGIAEEVLNLLARLRELRVISRSSAFALRDEDLEAPEIAQRLNVAHILEGSIRRAGNRIRVTAQLIDARSDTHLWSHTYERDLDNVFQIQDEIASDVVANLQIELLGDMPKIRYVDPEVLSLTAQAEQLWQTRPPGTGVKMQALLNRALEIDPEHIPAWDKMVGAQWFLMEETGISYEEMLLKVGVIQGRIRELDPDSAYLDYYDGFMYSGEFELEKAATLFNRGLEKDLTVPDNVRLAGYFARHIGKTEVAARILRYALAIDPLCHQCRRRYAESLMYAGDYESARQEFERYLMVAYEGSVIYANILLLQEKPDEALSFVESGGADDHWEVITRTSARAKALYSLGRVDEAQSLFEELRDSGYEDERALKLLLTEIAAWFGDKDYAFENLFELVATNFQYLHRMTFSPVWRNLHDDPRWDEFLEISGLSPKRINAIDFDPNMPE